MHTAREQMRLLGEDMLQHLEATVERHLAAKHSIPGYTSIPRDESFAQSFGVGQAIIHLVILKDGGYAALRPSLLPVIEERARSGVPIGSVLRAWQNGQHILFEAIEDSAARLGLAPDTAREANARIMRGLEEAMADISAAYDRVAAERERDEIRAVETLLHDLFFGTNPTADRSLQLRAVGLSETERYVPLLARPAAGSDAASLVTSLRRQARSAGGMVGMLGDDVAGIVVRPPDPDGISGVVAVGPPTAIADARRAFAVAARVLESAWAFGLTGVQTIGSVGLRLAIGADQELGEHLVERCLAPLAHTGEFGEELVRTLEAWFECGLSHEEAARKLFVHRNTLSKRLRRYETLTGVDLGNTEDLFSVWWALRYRARSVGARGLERDDERVK